MIQPIPELSSWRSTYSVCTYLYAYTHSGFQIPIRYVLVPYVCPPPASYNLSVGSEIGHSLPTFFNPARYPAFNKEKITIFIKAIMIVVGCQKLMDKEYFLTNGFKNHRFQPTRHYEYVFMSRRLRQLLVFFFHQGIEPIPVGLLNKLVLT